MAFDIKSNENGYAVDINTAANNNFNGYLTGNVTSVGAGLSVDISAGDVLYQTNPVTLAGANIVLDVADVSYPRIDLIVYNGTSLTKVTGLPSTEPKTPTYDVELNLVLARVLVPANAVVVLAGNIKDLRVLGGGSGSGGSAGGLAKFEQNFTSQTVVVVSHFLNDLEAMVQVIDASGVTIPASTITSITRDTANQVTVVFVGLTTGTVLVTGGQFAGTGGNGLISFKETFTSQTSIVVTHSLADSNPLVQVFDNNSQWINPDNITINTSNQLTVTFTSSTTGTIIVQGGQAGVSGTETITPAGTQGRIMYDNGTNWVTLNPGNDGQVLQTKGASADPTWTDVDINKAKNVKEQVIINVTDVTSAATITLANTNEVILFNEGSNDIYFNFGATSVLNDFVLLAGKNMTLVNFDKILLSAICDTGLTSTLKALLLDNSLNHGGKTNYEMLVLNTTDISGLVSFSNTVAFKDIIITNQGINSAFFDLDAVASLNNVELKAGKSFVMDNADFDDISAICNSGLTTTLKILAIY